MKKLLSFILAAVLVSLLCVTAYADALINSADKSDHEDGMPYWYPYDRSGFTDFHGKDLPRVVDDADILSDEEEAKLSARIAGMAEEYGIGYVFFSDVSNHGLSPEEYSSDFLHFNGYGVGDEYGAVVFYLCFEPGNRCWRTTSINSYESVFTADVLYEIDEKIDSAIREGDYFEGCMIHADCVEAMLTRGKLPTNPLTVLKAIGIGLLVGLFIAFIRVSSLKKKMKVVRPTGASNYVVPGSYNVRDRRVDYLYTTVTRTAKPKQSSSGRGGSSFSSGHSSGGSYSSGGRSF